MTYKEIYRNASTLKRIYRRLEGDYTKEGCQARANIVRILREFLDSCIKNGWLDERDWHYMFYFNE